MKTRKPNGRRELPHNAAVLLAMFSLLVGLLLTLFPGLRSRLTAGVGVAPLIAGLVLAGIALFLLVVAAQLFIAKLAVQRETRGLMREIAAIRREQRAPRGGVRIVEAARPEARHQALTNYLSIEWAPIVGVEAGSPGAMSFVLSEFARRLGAEQTAASYLLQFETYLSKSASGGQMSKQLQDNAMLREMATAFRYYQRRLTECTRHRNLHGQAVALCGLGQLAFAKGDLEDSKQRFGVLLQFERSASNITGQALALFQLGRIAQVEHDLVTAKRLFRQALLLSRKQENLMVTAAILVTLGQLLLLTSLTKQDLSTAEPGIWPRTRQRRIVRREGQAMLIEAAQLYQARSQAHLRFALAAAASLGFRIRLRTSK
jgi:hypothetical protein